MADQGWVIPTEKVPANHLPDLLEITLWLIAPNSIDTNTIRTRFNRESGTAQLPFWYNEKAGGLSVR